jgi:hypothetical protein
LRTFAYAAYTLDHQIKKAGKIALRSEKHWFLDYNIITIYRLWDPVRKRVHISRNIIFNEIELIENINVKNLSQDITASINIIIINTLTENKKNKFIAARTRKTISKIKLPKEAMRITKIFTKFINMIVLRRNPNIVYENFIEENSILSKIMIAKIILNKDKPSYEIEIINPKIL